MLHRNLSLKLAALALAIFLWFWVMLSEHPDNPGSRFRVSAPPSLPMTARVVPVVVQTRGSLSPGLRLVSVQVEPPLLTLVGEAHRLGRVREIRTVPLEMGQVTRSFSKRLQLLVPSGTGVLNSRTVTVTVEVESARSQAGPPTPERPGK